MNRSTKLALGPVLAAVCGGGAALAGLPTGQIATAAVTGWCAAWWILEPVAIPVTSLIPFVALPAAGVLDHKQVATSYGHHMIILLLGGFMLSAGVEKSGVHRRMALAMVAVAGSSGRALVGGFMVASAVSSMWISNTATTLVLLPVALAVINGEGGERLAIPVLLGIAYAASIGGMATPIGTPPNLIFMSNYEKATGDTISFLSWMRIGVPVVIVLVPIAWAVVTRGLGGVAAPAVPRPGKWRSAEVRVSIVFAVTALAWVFRTAPFGGWTAAVGAPGIGDSTIALAGVLVMFVWVDADGEQLLDWHTARKIPWGLLLLFGGGLAISAAFESSGLSTSLGHGFALVADWPAPLMMLVICLAVTFMTEVTSNTATTALLMPILVPAAATAKLAPELLMIPATLSASCAFMMPVATAPNAIVAGTEHVTTRDMARVGIWLNLLGAVAITGVLQLLL